MLTARHLAKTFDTRGPLAIIDDVSLEVKPVSYTHLTLPTNREV